MNGTGTVSGNMSTRVGRRIAQLRRKHAGGIQSQAKFAARIGISPSYLAKIEQGTRDIPLGILERAGRELGVDPIDLLTADGQCDAMEPVCTALLPIMGRLRDTPDGIARLVHTIESLDALLDLV